MRRFLIALALAGGLGACRKYDNYSPVVNQDGLIPATQYARYGTEQAETMAIARSLGKWYVDETIEGKTKQVTAAANYAKTLPRVVTVVADTLGARLTVTFKSGWRTSILPVNDGVEPEATPGVTAAAR